MNQLKKTLPKVRTFALLVLGIVPGIGITSLIASPWGLWRPEERIQLERCSVPEPGTLTLAQRYDFNHAVWEFRERGCLEPPTWTISVTSDDPLGDLIRESRNLDKWKAFKAHVIAQAERLEAQEFRESHFP